jgi:hypothetical protein
MARHLKVTALTLCVMFGLCVPVITWARIVVVFGAALAGLAGARALRQGMA